MTVVKRSEVPVLYSRDLELSVTRGLLTMGSRREMENAANGQTLLRLPLSLPLTAPSFCSPPPSLCPPSSLLLPPPPLPLSLCRGFVTSFSRLIKRGGDT